MKWNSKFFHFVFFTCLLLKILDDLVQSVIFTQKKKKKRTFASKKTCNLICKKFWKVKSNWIEAKDEESFYPNFSTVCAYSLSNRVRCFRGEIRSPWIHEFAARTYDESEMDVSKSLNNFLVPQILRKKKKNIIIFFSN